MIQSCTSPDSNENTTAADNHLSVIPKRPRLSLEPSVGPGTSSSSPTNGTERGDGDACLGKDHEPEYSSDSEMLPVKQEMIELVRECEFGDAFPDESYFRSSGSTNSLSDASSCAIMKAAVSAATGSGMGSDALSSSHPPAPPPPPGTLMPSYIPPPPPQIKSQDGEYNN